MARNPSKAPSKGTTTKLHSVPLAQALAAGANMAAGGTPLVPVPTPTPTPAPTPGLAVVATMAQALAAAGQAAAAQAAPAPAPALALRGGLVVAAVALTGRPYRVTAPHNISWWQTVTQAIAQGQGQASVQTLVAAGVPATMVGYLVRRGYCKAVQPAAPATQG